MYKKESNVELVEQKKEMFLVTMQHGIIENEIKKLKSIAHEKNDALLLSDKMLEKDKQDFNHYLDENKRASEQAQ